MTLGCDAAGTGVYTGNASSAGVSRRGGGAGTALPERGATSGLTDDDEEAIGGTGLLAPGTGTGLGDFAGATELLCSAARGAGTCPGMRLGGGAN